MNATKCATATATLAASAIFVRMMPLHALMNPAITVLAVSLAVIIWQLFQLRQTRVVLPKTAVVGKRDNLKYLSHEPIGDTISLSHVTNKVQS